MISAGYMLKAVVARPDWLGVTQVREIFSVSGCISHQFADYARYWEHNGYWLFDSAAKLFDLTRAEKIDTNGMRLFFYEVYEKQFDVDKKCWADFEPQPEFELSVAEPGEKQIQGYDVVSFSCGTSPECSPLSCNAVATEVPVNEHCLFSSFEEAKEALESGKFDTSEPGPFRIFAVYLVTTKQLAKISKFLSLILRHKPEEVGLGLDKAGWADVDELIEKMNSSGTTITREQLDLIVISDEKHRYSFTPDGKRIRANQGHSLAVDLGLNEQKPPQRLYHGTASRFIESIMQTGLQKQSRLHVHLSESVETAHNVGRRYGKPVILTIEAARMHADGYKFFRSENNVWLTDHVPVEYINVVASESK